MAELDIRTQQLIEDCNVLAAKLEVALAGQDDDEANRIREKFEAMGANLHEIAEGQNRYRVLWEIVLDEHYR